MATQTYIKQVSGQFTEARTVETSAGAGDANKVPNTNANGVLDITVTNGVTASAGAGSSGKLAALDVTGRLDSTMMPVGVVADTATFTSTEAIAAGDWVNIHNSTGAKVRRADASNGRPAHGFVLAGITNGGTGTVYFEGTNTQVSGRTPGATQFLSQSVPGGSVETAPSVAAQTVQALGVALSATSVSFEPQPPITLA